MLNQMFYLSIPFVCIYAPSAASESTGLAGWCGLRNAALAGSHFAFAHAARAGAHHYRTTGGGVGAGFECAFLLNALDVLLVLDFFLHVLVSLQDLVVLYFAQLQPFVHAALQFFLEGVHFVGLPRQQVRLARQDFLVYFY